MRILDKHIAFFLLTCLTILNGCADELRPVESGGDWQLRLLPSVQSLSTKTTPGDADRDENTLGSHLDVFFQREGDDSFLKQYHLSEYTFTEEGVLLSDNWRVDGFQAGVNYNVYAIVNGPAAVHVNVESLTELKSITDTDNDIFRVKKKDGDYVLTSEDDPSGSCYINSKPFLMDGMTTWCPDTQYGAAQIVGNPIPMNMIRAAAKIVVIFSINSNVFEEGEEPGLAMFKFENFAFKAPVLTGGEVEMPDIRTADGFMYANQQANGVSQGNYIYGITTYSYPYSWTSIGDAPSLLVRIPFIKGGISVDHYYRFPIRQFSQEDPSLNLNSLERNEIYVVNASLESRGSY